MNDFLDILEIQLADAADRRHRRRRALPRLGIRFETLATATAVAAALALVVVLGGNNAEQHSATTPVGAPMTLPAAAVGTRVVVLNRTGEPGRGAPAAERLRAGGADVVRIEDVRVDDPLGSTDVQHRPGEAPAALAISRYLGGIGERDAGLRVFPIGATTAGLAAGTDYDVVVSVGLDNEKTRLAPADTPVAFTSEGCPAGARVLAPADAADAADAVLRAWPASDGAVPRAYGLAGELAQPGTDHRSAIARQCGDAMVARTALVALHLTGNEGDPDSEEVVVYVSRVGSGWDAWTATR